MTLTVVIPHRVRRDLLLRALEAVEGTPVLVVDDTDDGLDLDVPMVRLGGGTRVCAGRERRARGGADALRRGVER